MGKKTKIILASWLFAFSACGCEPSTKIEEQVKTPVIKITKWSISNRAGITVEYFNHNYSFDGRNVRDPLTVDLTTSKDIKEYRTQIESLLKELVLMEDELKIREDEASSHEPNTIGSPQEE